MAVTVIEPGRKVKVSPGSSGMDDVLEYAELAILGYGFRKGPHEDTEAQVWEDPGKYGLSLHDAIGYAFVRLTARSEGATGTKDGTLYGDDEFSFDRSDVYEAVHMAIEAEMPGARAEFDAAKVVTEDDSGGVFENWFNNTTDQETVIRVLRRAREATVVA